MADLALVDFAWQRPSVAALLAARVNVGGKPTPISGVCRYASYDPSKDLSLAEALAYGKVGLGIVANWESTGTSGYGGAPAGTTEGQAARAVFDSCEWPAWAPCYISADTAVQPSDYEVWAEYLAAFARSCGHPARLYGPEPMVAAMVARGVVQPGDWQANAWNPAAVVATGAALVQELAQVNVSGVSCDLDVDIAGSLAAIGAWIPTSLGTQGVVRPAGAVHESPYAPAEKPKPKPPGESPIVGVARGAQGYYQVDAEGVVSAWGGAPHYGDLRNVAEKAVAMAQNFTAEGYWILTDEGGVFPFGDAGWEGSPKANGEAVPPGGWVGILPGDTAGYGVADAAGHLHGYGGFDWAGSRATPV